MNNAPVILQLCPSPGPLGGIWTYIRHIMQSRLAERFRFEVCFYPGSSVGPSLRVVQALSEQIQRHQPDLIHLHGLQTEGFNCMQAARRAGPVPRLLTVHGFIEDSRFRKPWRRALIARILEPATLRAADAVFAVSRYGAEKPAMKRWARRSLGWVDNALPAAPEPEPGLRERQRAAFGWAPDDVVAICVARISREKGLLDLVDAFRLARLAQPKLRLLLVGDGPDAGVVRQRLANDPAGARVTLQAATSDVAPLLHAADLFVLPSLHENQSFAILEAMAAGLPVLSTRVGGTPELIRHGETGWLVEPAQPAALAEALVKLAGDADERARLGRAGLEAVQREHNFEDFVERLERIYLDLLGGKP